jgi:hypothetical protein
VTSSQHKHPTERICASPGFHELDFGGGLRSPGSTPLDVLEAQADVDCKDGVRALATGSKDLGVARSSSEGSTSVRRRDVWSFLAGQKLASSG